MKKLIATCIFFTLILAGKVSAQRTVVQNGSQLEILDAASLKEGQNSMLIKEGKGTLQFTKSGDRFTNVSFKDSAGVVIQLTPAAAGTQGAPKPACKYPLPDACFGTADKNIGLCICKPSDISGGYIISFIRTLPGRKKVQDIKLKKAY